MISASTFLLYNEFGKYHIEHFQFDFLSYSPSLCTISTGIIFGVNNLYSSCLIIHKHASFTILVLYIKIQWSGIAQLV
jgi:hypothetical protein